MPGAAYYRSQLSADRLRRCYELAPERVRQYLDAEIMHVHEGLVGEIDHSATIPGEIVCKDGFRFGTFGANDFARLCAELGVQPTIAEVDESSVFCEVAVPGPTGRSAV